MSYELEWVWVGDWGLGVVVAVVEVIYFMSMVVDILILQDRMVNAWNSIKFYNFSP